MTLQTRINHSNVGILIAEDSPTQREQLRYLLEENGYRVAAASNGNEALLALRQETPALIISDIVMPEMDGYTLCREVKSQPALKNVPVILLTSLASPIDIIRGLECGADNFIPKPYEEDYLLSHIQNTIINFDLRKRQNTQLGVEIIFANEKHFITSDRQQILDLLLSTYEAAVQKNLQLNESQKELKKLNEQLDQKVEELEAQNRRVREVDRVKSEFLANMSHELRTPLNGIIGFSEILHDGKAGDVSATQKEYLGDILTSSKHLLQLINDVLDLAKVESGKMDFQPASIELKKVVRETCDIVRTMAAKKRLKIETHIDAEVDSLVLDAGKFKQVLYNYLSNAIKFTPDEGRIVVRAAPEGQTDFRLEVEDTGIGIKPDDIGRLFVEFQQLDPTRAKKYQGTGLGLALTKKLVEAQGGSVGVNSILGKGSTFFAILPRNSETILAARQSADDKPVPVTRPGAPTVLVVEDDAKEQSWLANIISGARYNVEVAGTGAKALALCQERTFDGIMLDLILPDMNGWDVLRKIRVDGPNQTTPIIVVTVVADKSAAVGDRVDEFLVKPVVDSDLIAAMKRAGIAEDKSKGILCVDDDAGSLKLKDVTHEDRVRLQASVRAMVSKGPEGTAHLLEEIDIHVGIGPPDTTRTE